ncbi:DUF3617 family protein [Aurantiacibacter gilvus]|uniref:DUF3617 family protein n=1 Tax=Aurantiacibacter gilvus TaxID=3139141 RepID=A0ABU9IGW6_9SPHN
MGLSSVVAAATVALTPAVAQAPELAMLDTLTRGAWEFRARGDDDTLRICVRTGRELIQLRHRQTNCEQFIVQDDANEVTVQYTCRGSGYGRTSIRKEGSTLVQIRSQGTYSGTPFSLVGEARRTGSC